MHSSKGGGAQGCRANATGSNRAGSPNGAGSLNGAGLPTGAVFGKGVNWFGPLLVVLWLCIGCIGRPTVLRLPSEGGPEWTAYRSQHFVLYTNAGSEDADEVLAAFEQTHALMRSAMSADSEQVEHVMRIIAFESQHELAEFLGPNVAGMYLTKLPLEQQPHPTMIVQADASRFNRSLFAHEFAHRTE